MKLKNLFIILMFVSISFNSNAEWKKQNSGTIENLNSVYCINEDTCWAVGDNNTILKTYDAGNNWNHCTIGEVDSTIEWLYVQFINKKGWIASSSWASPKKLLISNDSGETWSINDFPGLGYNNEMIFVNEGFGLANKYKTTDGGKNWEYLNINPSSAIHCDFAIDEKTFWLGCLQGQIYRTSNGGNSWNETKFDETSPNIYFINANIGWAFAYDKLYQSVDGGDIWQLIYTHNDNYWGKSIKFVNENFGCMVAARYDMQTNKSYGQLYITHNGGLTWDKQFTQSISGMNSVSFIDSSYGWSVGNDGTIFKWKTITNSVKDNTNCDSNLPSKYFLFQNYPNPFNPATTIKYNLSKSSDVILKIYNLSGQELETLVNGFQKKGEYEITWEPKGLPSGIYFYILQAGKYSESKKLILQR